MGSSFIEETVSWFSAFSDPYFLRSTTKDFFTDILSYLRELFPYVIIGCLLGELLKYTSWTKLIYRFTKNHTVFSVISATVLGILSPLCTYGTVPVLISLYHGGISLGSLIAFLAASSMMNPQLFIMTVGGLGWEMAWLRLLCVFVFSALCGFCTIRLPASFVVRKKIRIAQEDIDAIENRPKKEFLWKKYLCDVIRNLLFVGRMMLLGITIAAFVDMLPMALLFGEIDTTKPIGILFAAAAGIPVYACGGGTIPLIASLLDSGLSRGSALAFLTVGPATRITSLAAIATIFRKRFLLCYVVLLLVFSVVAGILLV